MNERAVVPFSELQNPELDLNQAVSQAQAMNAVLRQMGVKEATFESGVHFAHNAREGVSAIATDRVLVIEREHTTSVTFRNQGSSEQEAMQELSQLEVTQKLQGAFSGGKSQSWVSLQNSESSDD